MQKNAAVQRERYYSAYGETLRTREDFDGLLVRCDDAANFHYIVSEDTDPRPWKDPEIVYQSPHAAPDGTPRLMLWHQSRRYRVRFSSIATFQLTPTSITCYPRPDVSRRILDAHLLGPIMSLWLEKHGIPTLHASSAVMKAHAVAFLSYTGGGKSALVAALMQAGYPMLTDDILPVERHRETCIGRSGYPRMRLWPDEATYFLGQFEDLEREHPASDKRRVPVGAQGFGAFCEDPHPIACFYLLERKESEVAKAEIEITPVLPRDAVIELVRHSYAAHIVQALGLQPQRLRFFAQMVQQVPVRRLVYPSGFDELSRIPDAVLKDLMSI